MKIWVDFTNPPHVNFFKPFLNSFKKNGYKTQCTSRKFAETTDLLRLHNIEHTCYGKHAGRNKHSKISAMLKRFMSLYYGIDDFDISFSSNYEAPFISFLKKKKSFVFDDNDISPNWLYSKFATHVVSPKYINREAMYDMGISEDQLITYNGFKENIYIADYIPDPDFLDTIPFDEFVTVRPENIQASYVPEGVRSIVPKLIEKLTQKDINVLFLPRYDSDNEMIVNSDNVFIPGQPLNGLDVCYYSNAVLTGAGSFSRESAIIGTPAVSFFAGEKFLGVDQEMFRRGWVKFSRHPDEIVNHVLKSEKKQFSVKKSKVVQTELLTKLRRHF